MVVGSRHTLGRRPTFGAPARRSDVAAGPRLSHFRELACRAFACAGCGCPSARRCNGLQACRRASCRLCTQVRPAQPRRTPSEPTPSTPERAWHTGIWLEARCSIVRCQTHHPKRPLLPQVRDAGLPVFDEPLTTRHHPHPDRAGAAQGLPPASCRHAADVRALGALTDHPTLRRGPIGRGFLACCAYFCRSGIKPSDGGSSSTSTLTGRNPARANQPRARALRPAFCLPFALPTALA